MHGNVKKKEAAPDGSKDENVFDIQQGVAISIMVRKSDEKKKLGVVKFVELYGKRNEKYFKLNENKLNIISWKNLKCVAPYYFFTIKDFSMIEIYEEGFKINEMFANYGTGIKTNRDKLLVDFSPELLLKKIDIIKKKKYFRD